LIFLDRARAMQNLQFSRVGCNVSGPKPPINVLRETIPG
jgi:hypothetical protein